MKYERTEKGMMKRLYCTDCDFSFKIDKYNPDHTALCPKCKCGRYVIKET